MLVQLLRHRRLRFEWNNIKTKNFELFTRDCFVTDDSIMTLGVAKAIMKAIKIGYPQKNGCRPPSGGRKAIS